MQRACLGPIVMCHLSCLDYFWAPFLSLKIEALVLASLPQLNSALEISTSNAVVYCPFLCGWLRSEARPQPHPAGTCKRYR